MINNIIGKCPVCSSNLSVTELSCNSCNTKIQGHFKLSKFDYLTNSQKEFALVFIKNAGNIKLIEKELGISYPTVKKNIDDLISSLGFDKEATVNYGNLSKEEIYEKLRNKTISFDEAESLLKEIDEND